MNSGENSYKLTDILKLLRDIVKNASSHDNFDYPDEPVSNTDWDYIPDDSVRVVYNLDGRHCPQINTHNWYDQCGIVITFDADLGGDCQIFFNRRLLAVRQKGNPAGWSYLGLDGNEKLYIDEDTADVLNKIAGRAYHNGDVSAKSVKQLKRALHKTDQVAHDTREALLQTNDSVADNHVRVDSLEARVNKPSVAPTPTSMNTSNLATKSDLNNYVSNKSLDSEKTWARGYLANIENHLHQLATKYDAIKSSVDTLSLQAGHTNPDSINTVKQDLQKYANSVTRQFAGIDLNKMKATIHRMNVRYMDLVNAVKANAQGVKANTDSAKAHTTTLGSLGNSIKNLQTNVGDLTKKVASIDLGKVKATLHKIDLRAATQDSKVSALQASASASSNALTETNNEVASVSSQANSTAKKESVDNSLLAAQANQNHSGVSLNANRLNQADAKFYKLDQHDKKADKRETDLTSEVSANASNTATVTSNLASNDASLSVNASQDALRLNQADSKFYALNQHNKKADKREADLTSAVNSDFGSAQTAVSSLSAKGMQNGTALSQVSNGVSENAKRLNSADNHFFILNQHNKKADKRNTDAQSALSLSASSLATGAAQNSAAVSMNAKRLNDADAKFYQLNQHDKKSDKRNSDAIASLVSNDTSYSNILTNHASNLNSLANNIKTLNGQVPSGISLNASMINADANTLYAIRHTIHKMNVRNDTLASSMANAETKPEASALAQQIALNKSSLANAYTSLASVSTSASNANTSLANKTNALSNGVSMNASQLNSSAADMWKFKQSYKKSNKRNTDAETSLSGAATSLSTNKEDKTSEQSDVTSLKAQVGSLSSANASMSAALSTVISALSK